MTDFYVNSAAGGANSGLNETDAWTTIDSCFVVASTAGDRVFVDPAHNETRTTDSNWSANANHTRQNPLQIIVAVLSTLVQVADYGAANNGEIDGNNARHIQATGNIYVYGMRIIQGDTTNIANDYLILEKCYLEISKSSTTEWLDVGTGNSILMIDTDVVLNGTNNHYLRLAADGKHWKMIGGSITSDGTSTGIFQINSASSGSISCIGVDLSGVSSSRALINMTGLIEGLTAEFVNCVTSVTAPDLIAGTVTNLVNSKVTFTGANGYTRREQQHNGYLVEDTTIYRNGGAADSDSATNFSFKIESTSNASKAEPFRILLACQDYGNLSGKTLKIHFAQDAGAPTAITSADIWIESHAATSTGIDFQTTSVAPTGAGSTLTDESGSEDWRNGAGALSGYTEQSMSLSGFGTTQGVVYIWLCVPNDYSTDNLYVCPKIEIA